MLIMSKVFDSDEVILSQFFSQNELLTFSFMEVFSEEELIYLCGKGILGKQSVEELVHLGHVQHFVLDVLN